ncbi:unconventional myosin-xix [Plakobranchus ocellatus]|uniref:Unconventional myosin-xix n=1 Tax=Plakobranchus ocellatus TaxID=259542 RepID=A0AAV4C0H1_9GAST|nr:unconventional myosin-xix [Plakobranchus ocellatus]
MSYQGNSSQNQISAKRVDDSKQFKDSCSLALQQSGHANLTKGQLVYVRDNKHGWRRAVVAIDVESAQGFVTLAYEDGQNVKRKLKDVLLRAENSDMSQISSLTEVTPINEATVLECLHQRFSIGSFYTLAGSTVVAINPFKDVNRLYSLHNIWTYYESKNKEVLEPHVYLIADKAYRCMKRQMGRINQSIIVSGESGAGKTVSAKHLLRFLTIVSSPESDIDLDSSVPGSIIERRVLDSNPLLEAFGNAATPRNDNSSRFGKFIQLQFHRNGVILGGVIQTYLLEKTRVVHQGKGENNFHIFYQLFSMQEEPQLPAWLEPVKAEIQASRLECSLITADKEHSIQTTLNAMSEIGIQPTTQAAIFKTLLVILHIMTLKFLAQRDGESTSYSEDQETVRAKEESARLLGVSSESLQYALLNRSIVSGGGGEDKPSRRSVFHKPLIVVEAESRRDCLAMLLYSSLFDWLVNFINHQIRVEHFDHSIGLLDIYGFEAFEVNSLEQLCINYANERLQQHYVVHFLRDLQYEYEAEGIAWKSVAYIDNKNCVEALDGLTGVFGVLNEDVYLNRKSVDHQVCSRIIEACNNLDLVHKSHAGTYGNQFIISHFAGDVLYTVEGAVTKNKDIIPPEILSLLQSSSNSFILELFSDNHSSLPPSASHGAKKQRKRTVLSKFKSSLDNLLTSLGDSDVHYIRCIKPNTQSLQEVFDPAFVLQQLKACGTIQTVDICRRGYPARMTYYDFVQRYQVFTRTKHYMHDTKRVQLNKLEHELSGEKDQENEKGTTDSLFITVERRLSKMQSSEYHSDFMGSKECRNYQRLSIDILVSVFDHLLLVGVEIQFGHSKIFLTQKQIEHLEETRTRVINHLVCLAQACWRGYLHRTKYQQTRLAVVIIQTSWRAHSERQRFKMMQKAASVIQRKWAAHRLRCSVKALSKASKVIKRSLIKWVRRGKSKQALQKLQNQKEKDLKTQAAGRETEQVESESGEYKGFQPRLSQDSIDFFTSSTVAGEVQHSTHLKPWQSPSLSNLYIEESTDQPVHLNPINLDVQQTVKYGDTMSGTNNQEADTTLNSEAWSEDSGIISQVEAISGDSDNTVVSPKNDHGHKLHHQHQPYTPVSIVRFQEPARDVDADALNLHSKAQSEMVESTENLKHHEVDHSSQHPDVLRDCGNANQGAMAGTRRPIGSTLIKMSAEWAPTPAKKPRANTTEVERQGDEENSGKTNSSSRELKNVKVACKDEGAGGDYRQSDGKKRRGRRKEDLHFGNGVLSCRRLTKAGYRFHVRSSVLKHGHRAHYSYLPHGLPDALSTDDDEEGSISNRWPM